MSTLRLQVVRTGLDNEHSEQGEAEADVRRSPGPSGAVQCPPLHGDTWQTLGRREPSSEGAPGGSLLCPWSWLGQGSSLDCCPRLCPLLVATVTPETPPAQAACHRHCFKIWAQLTMGSTQSRSSASFHSLGHQFALSGKGEFTTMS